jgi:hypothetical protein
MPNASTYARGSTFSFSWYDVDSTLHFLFRLDDRRTGSMFWWAANRYTVRIGATSAVSAYSDGSFQCGGSSTSQGSQYNCRV